MSSSIAPPLDERVRHVAGGMRADLLPIVRAIEGDSARPTHLARTLSLDKNLTSRILRALRNKEPLGVASQIPAPQGLRMFVAAARRAGVNADLCAAAEDSIREFERLIEEQAGGRTALDAAISGWLPDTRRRGERTAMQAAHKSMCYLLGYQVETLLSAHIVQPSADGQFCDRVDIIGRYGVRRMRNGPPITVAFNQIAPLDFTGRRPPRLETIDGRPVRGSEDPCELLEYCTDPLPPLDVTVGPSVARYSLSANAPPINAPVTLVFGHLVRDAQTRYRTPAQREEWLETVPRIPARALIMDVFVRDDAWPGTPTITPRLFGPVTNPQGRDDAFIQLDRLDMSADAQNLGPGIDRVHNNDIEGYPEMLRGVFDRVGWDAQRFRGYRCRVQYPVPSISYTMWFDLRSAPPTP